MVSVQSAGVLLISTLSIETTLTLSPAGFVLEKQGLKIKSEQISSAESECLHWRIAERSKRRQLALSLALSVVPIGKASL
jgi:hypothetical protein